MWLLLVACKSEVEFPPGLEPLEENKAPAPEGSDEWPETLSMLSGEEEDYVWTHARAYVQVAGAEVAAAVQDPEVGVDRRRVVEFAVTWDVEPEYEVSYAVATTVDDVVTVQYDLTWRHGAVGDDVWATRWQKTAGTDLIKIIEGSIVTTEVVHGVTELSIIEHIGAPLASNEDLLEDTEGYLTDFYASILAVSHGDPLPTY